jgi:hypothetical protein
MNLDQQREKSITDLGLLIEGAMHRWDVAGCFHARGQADGYLRAMEALIRGRSAAKVASMELERGLV